MEKNKIQIWIWVLVAIVVVIVLFLIFTNKQAVKPVTVNQVTTGTDSVQDISAQDTGTGAVSISYANALIKYANRRIQLNATCQATPNNVTYKDNTGIMIDNRSSQARTVKVGITFTIKPWGFKIVVLPDVYLTSKTLLVDCDGFQNVATILVQE